jgi:hypothetical protein
LDRNSPVHGSVAGWMEQKHLPATLC